MTQRTPNSELRTPNFEPVIGLEIHAQLLTRTKIFCGCPTAFGAPPNTHVCPVCLGMPGTLPVLNAAAVEYAARAALALNCAVHAQSVFARKNYFYPDLPKGYQISQYDRPLATGGWVDIGPLAARRRVRITRVHMEEDAGKSLHHGFPDSDRATYVDCNRAGVPLIEIVSEPDLRTAAEASDFFERVRELLIALGVNDGNMEEGSLRCDANVSLRREGDETLGTKTEVKNVNSFRFLRRALEHEIERQAAILDGGGAVMQETRLWDSAAGVTVSMRSKEDADDYRYFPEPDLPPLVLERAWVDAQRAALPELPDARIARLMRDHGLVEYDAETLVRAVPGGADYFEAVVAAGAASKAAANWMLGDVQRVLKEQSASLLDFAARVPPDALAELLRLLDDGTIGGSAAKQVFETMASDGGRPSAIVEAAGLSRISDQSAIEALVDEVLAAHAGAVAEFRAGKTQTFGFLVGQVMKASKGRADAATVNALLRKKL
ncbi:MAG TPA: Asp-tRNA(Asn)/Glu-tRNA(Gln) amidotransferase subunit GatB [Vicinamibacterales bacterium]|nr:Asp-tRNA(Asn)/Glu-tRNA(Gln) amidotransferase subunit GatB [Vicinamibacterales bacterium]